MADGTGQHTFNMPAPQASRLRPGEIVVDLFAGGGGASTGLRMALGRDPDIAINHDALAIGMHAANHPFTRHLQEDIWHADPVREVGHRLVGWLHASPDCTHFSQAKGGQPRDRATRSLSWVGLKWAGKLRKVGRAPRLFSMENVKQILLWGPLIAKRDKATGRVLKLGADGKPCGIAAPGERVPLREQWLIPDPKHAGRTWRRFVALLRALGYDVEWKRLVASQFEGGGTQRDRLFLCARRDGQPIRWPAPKYAKKRAQAKASGLPPPMSAADAIDWSIQGRSIFDRPRPLAEKTMTRIAKGVMRFVVDCPDPFIVPLTHAGDRSVPPVTEPLATITGANRGELAVCQPVLAPFFAPRYGEAPGQTPRATAADEPMATIVPTGNSTTLVTPVLAPFLTEHANGSNQRNMAANDAAPTFCAGVKGGHIALVAPVLVQAGHGAGKPGGVQRWGDGTTDVRNPLGATTASGGGGHAVAAAHLVKFRGDSAGAAADEPMPVITSGAGAARPAGCAHAMGIATAFLERANGGSYDGAGDDVRDPAPTVCAQGSITRLVTAHMQPMQQHSPGADAREPVGAVLAGGTHHAAVECELLQAPSFEDWYANTESYGGSREEYDRIYGEYQRPEGAKVWFHDADRCARHVRGLIEESLESDAAHHTLLECGLTPDAEAGALRVAAFLMRYYGQGGQWGELAEPLATVTTKHRLALVTVWLQGEPYVIVDIRLRMLEPHELYRAQGFPADYIIDRTADGRKLSKSAQVRMVGNSVSPPPMAALVDANLDPIPLAMAA